VASRAEQPASVGHGPTIPKTLAYFDGIAGERAGYRKRFAHYYNELARYCGYFVPPDAAVLEVGCGTGELLAQMPGRLRVGIDCSPRMIAEARRQFPQLTFHVMAVEEICLPTKFDVIILSNLIGYLDDVQTALLALHRVCHERTKLIITYHNHVWEPLLALAETVGIKKRSPEQNWLSRKDICNLLYLAGFEPFRTAQRMLVPARIPVLSPLLNRFVAVLPGIRHLALNQFVFARPQSLRREQAPRYSVSVVIPARNESGNIEEAIRRLPPFGASQEIIFVEGHSKDDTWPVIEDIAQRYQRSHRIVTARQDGKGKGDAVRKGFELATGDILMILDADLTTPPESLPRFYQALIEGKGDFIMGSRLVYPMDQQAMRFLNMVGNKLFSLTFSWLLDQPIKDTLCGTKVLFRSDYRQLAANRQYFGEFDPFGDYDLIFGAFKLGLKITEIPIRYAARTYGTTNISRFRHGWLLLEMCLFAARRIKFY
jgi:SAM-dependent methyltransferase